ncbi:hypothetical protein SVIO_025800 [Streptomyces violaceusniger]|uniref:PKS/mFAS DH domain-containing protein n=1 Tax=Streptomyces violaceusniger TaxID=68280 RepID=A0A4D4KZM6_STRVO|nr:hypothetical protein SVIO_025800 [Streptomyces violaceusniger]
MVAGVLSVEEGARLVALRSRALTALSGKGGMASVHQPAAEVEQRLAAYDGQLTVAAVNGPATTVVSGDADALDELLAACEADGVRARRIPVDYASHCAHVEEIRDEVEKAASGVVPRAPQVPFFSTVTGDTVDATELDDGYWYRNLRSKVRFEETVRAQLRAGFRQFVEVSAHPVLTTGVQTTAEDQGINVSVVGTLRRDEGDMTRLLKSVAEAFVGGAPVDWARASGKTAGQPVELPTYAFQRRRYWMEKATASAHSSASGMEATGYALLGAGVPLPGSGGFLFTGRLSLREQPWLEHHAVLGRVVVPGTALLDMALRAAEAVGCDRVDELTLETPLVLTTTEATHVQVLVTGADENDVREVSVHARPHSAAPDAWVRHARATLTSGGDRTEGTDLRTWPPTGGRVVETAGLYERLSAEGLAYGPAFQGLTSVWRGADGEVFAEVTLPDAPNLDASGFGLHPALLDAALHAWLACAGGVGGEGGGVRLPFMWAGVSLHATGATRLRVRLTPSAEGTMTVLVTDTDGLPVLSARSLVTRLVSETHFPAPSKSGASLYRVDWRPVSASAAAAGTSTRFAVIGGTISGLLEPEPTLAGCPDLTALENRLATGGHPVPDQVLVDLPRAPTRTSSRPPDAPPDRRWTSYSSGSPRSVSRNLGWSL